MSAPIFQIDSKHICLLLGIGLIGRQVFDSLCKNYLVVAGTDINVDWGNPNSLIQQLSTSLGNIPFDRLDIVWSAGSAGFGSSNQVLEKEFLFFRAFLNYINHLNTNVQFHHISSAGGLYEGGGFITDLKQVFIRRPYAKWKLKQEQLLNASPVYSRNYRVSSVYGISSAGNRMGLINTLVHNSIMNKPVRIFGNQNTLRDYIYNADIGRFIASQVLSALENDVYLLASGRAISVDNLIRVVEKSINKRIYVEYSPVGDNSSDIVFCPSVVENITDMTSLEEGVRLLCLRSSSQ